MVWNSEQFRSLRCKDSRDLVLAFERNSFLKFAVVLWKCILPSWHYLYGSSTVDVARVSGSFFWKLVSVVKAAFFAFASEGPALPKVSG
jgi:hypothetical protein